MNDAGEDVSSDEATAFHVVIEGRELHTNGMRPLLVSRRVPGSLSLAPAHTCCGSGQLPTRGLALAISAEFAKQGNMIHPPSTPLYNMACLAIDTFGPDADQQVERPHSEFELISETEKLQNELCDYLETDSVVCVRVCVCGRAPRCSCLYPLCRCVCGQVSGIHGSVGPR